MAKKYGIRPSGVEVLYAVASIKDLRTDDGNFNVDLFQRLPPYYKRRLEKDKFNELAINHLEMRIVNSVRVSDSELAQQYDFLNTKVKVLFLFEKKEGEEENSQLLVPIGDKKGRLENVMERIRRGENPLQAAKNEGIEVDKTDFFYFGGRIPLEGRSNSFASILEGNPDVYKNAFSLKPGSVSPIINVQGGRTVLIVLEQKKPDWSKASEKMPEIKQIVLNQKMNDYFSEWFAVNIRNAKIQNNLNRIFKE